MAYILSIIKGNDVETKPSLVERAHLDKIMSAVGSITSVKPGRWRFDDGVVGVDLSVDADDPVSEIQLKVGWSTSDQLLRILELATNLAARLDASVYDRNAQNFVTKERVAAMQTSGGASPAKRRT